MNTFDSYLVQLFQAVELVGIFAKLAVVLKLNKAKEKVKNLQYVKIYKNKIYLLRLMLLLEQN